MSKTKYVMVATCPIHDIQIRDMIAKCFYGTSNHAKYNMNTGEVWMWDKPMPAWRVVLKGKRVRLEYKSEEN